MSVSTLALLAALPFVAPGAPLGPPAAPVQDPAPAPEGGDEDELPDVLVITDKDRLLSLYFGRHGGRDAIAGLERLSFDLSFRQFDPETGEESPLEGVGPLHGDFDYGRRAKRMRLQSSTTVEQAEVPVVQLSDCIGQAQVFVDGEAVQEEEALLEALFVSKQVSSFLDLLYRPDQRGVLMRVEGVRRREGTEYLAAHIEFEPARQVYAAFRAFYSPETSLVERVDRFDPKTYRYVSTILLEDYIELGTLRFPTRWVFLGQNGQPERAWVLNNVTLNPEFPEGHFQAP